MTRITSQRYTVVQRQVRSIGWEDYVCYSSHTGMQPHNNFGGRTSISGGSMMLRKDLIIMTEGGPHVTDM